MKRLFINILRSIFRSPAMFLKFKDTVLVNGAEHLFRVNKYISDNKLGDFGEAIIDIGAAQGDTCKWFSAHYPNKKIFGFEPVHDSFIKAVEKTKKNRQIAMHRLALGGEARNVQIHVTNDSLASSVYKPVDLMNGIPETQRQKFRVKNIETVEQRRLDQVLAENQKFLLMKLDTQGSELDILKGGERTLSRTKLVLLEMSNHKLYEGAALYHEVDAFMRQHNFKLIDIYVTYRPKGVMSEFDALYQNTAI
jgi:FkbM family methyltransferase